MRLSSWVEKIDSVGDARGLGPMQAIELVKDRATKTPHPDAAKQLARFAYEHGVVVMTAGTFGNNVRFLLPLPIDAADLEAGLDVIEAGLEKIS
jgi:4-aminobutyrate aminotransferase/(S)-3-amino-2-methylpropionate transaminase